MFCDPDYIYNNYNNPDEHIKRLIYNNPNIFHYNPNYKGDNGYRPITVSMTGTVEVFDKGRGSIVKEKDTLIENDNFGIPYRYSYIQETGSTYKVVEINRNENSTVYYPYFYNITDYAKRLNPALKSYDPYDYPVFEYLQLGKEIYFGESFDQNNSSNFGEITVDYMYLVEGIKLKIIIRKNPYIDADISPCVYDYTINQGISALEKRGQYMADKYRIRHNDQIIKLQLDDKMDQMSEELKDNIDKSYFL